MATPPPKGSAGANLLQGGSFGDMVKKGKAETLKVPDGKGFGDLSGRKQNGNDKKQNNYSVTDANFNGALGVLKNNPDTGKPMNYVQDIQSYSAAGYIKTFHPDVYKALAAQQAAGKGTILGGALSILGVTKSADPALTAAGYQVGQLASEAVPGTNGAMNARAAVMDPKDATGQDWARPHHAESHWYVYQQMMQTGKVDYPTAMVLSGDDAISGSGRMNGVNGQDGKTGLNADERAVYQLAAQTERATGADLIGIMMRGHNMLMLDPSALTNPNINKFIGYPKDDRNVTPDRVNAVYQAFLNGTVGGDNDTAKEIHKFDVDAKGSYAAIKGTNPQIDQLVHQYPEIQQNGGTTAPTQIAPTPIQDAGAGVEQLGGAAAPLASIDALGGAAGLAGVLQALQAIMQQLVSLIQMLSSGVLGGGGIPSPAQDAMAGCGMMGSPAQSTVQTTQQTGASMAGMKM